MNNKNTEQNKKNVKENKQQEENQTTEAIQENEEMQPQQCNQEVEENSLENELETVKQQLTESQNNFLRTVAEFDNFKKRTQKEMSSTYLNAVADTAKQFLEVADNLSRAVNASKEQAGTVEIQKGVEMIATQFFEIFAQLKIEEIDPLNQPFNPDLHNAVMHVEDENAEENTVVEVFQKGYKLEDRVLRYAMVKVAN